MLHARLSQIQVKSRLRRTAAECKQMSDLRIYKILYIPTYGSKYVNVFIFILKCEWNIGIGNK